jgi:hypothetical protein
VRRLLGFSEDNADTWPKGSTIIHQPRLRRDAIGEPVQFDGSHHRWFEDRGGDGENANARRGLQITQFPFSRTSCNRML